MSPAQLANAITVDKDLHCHYVALMPALAGLYCKQITSGYHTKVLLFSKQGWPRNRIFEKDGNLAPFWHRRMELAVEQGCLLWGGRTVIPTKLRKQVLEELLEGYLGVVKMKSLARGLVWWPGIDKEIEKAAQSCKGCQESKQGPKLTQLHPWELPDGPWRRIHLDFAGPVEGKMLLIVVDAYSKWPEVVIMEGFTAESTVEEVRTLFSRWGLPVQMVTDNGPQFASQCFERFGKLNHIKHTKTSPYHPATNRLAERFVQTLKQAIQATRMEERSLRHRISNFLINYRNATHATMEESPAQLMLKRDLRSRLHLLRPSLEETVSKNQAKQIESRPGAAERNFEVGDTVVVRDYRRTAELRWIQGVVEAKYGSKTYLVRLKGRGVWKRHADQIMKDLSLRELPQEPQQEEAKQEVTPSRDKDEAGSQQGRGKESFQTNPPQEGLGTASNPETEVEDRAHSRGTNTIPEGKQAEGEVEEETESSGCEQSPPPRRTKSGRAVKRPNRFTDN